MLLFGGEGDKGARLRARLFRAGLILLVLGVCGMGAGALLQDRGQGSALAVITGAGALLGSGLVLALLARPVKAAAAAPRVKETVDADSRALEAREAKRRFRFKTAMIVLMMAVTMDVAVAVAVMRGATPPTPVTVVVLTSVTLGLAVLIAVFSHGDDARRLATGAGRRDREQRARTGRMFSVCITSAVLAVVAVLHGGDFFVRMPEFPGMMMVIAFATVILIMPAMVMNWDGEGRAAKRFLEDELTQAFRAKAIVTGFWVLLPGALGVYLAGLWRPEPAIAYMPLVLWAGAAAACLRFALLHRAAERDE